MAKSTKYHVLFTRLFEKGNPNGLLVPFNQDRLETVDTKEAYFDSTLYNVCFPKTTNKINYVHMIERAISRLAMPTVNNTLTSFGGFGFDADDNFYCDYYDGRQVTFNSAISSGITDFANERHIIMQIPAGTVKLRGTVVDEYGGETPYHIKTQNQDSNNRHSASAAIFAYLAYIIASHEKGNTTAVSGVMYKHYKDIGDSWASSDINTFTKAMLALDGDFYTLFQYPTEVRDKYGDLPFDPGDITESELEQVDLSSIKDMAYMVGDSKILKGGKVNAKATTMHGPKKEKTMAKLIAKGTYDLGLTLSDEDKQLVPSGWLDDFIPSDITLDTAQEIKASSYDPIPCRNILWTGETGTGKTTESQLLAALLGVPYRSMNLSSDKLSSDIITSCLPNNEKASVEDIEALMKSFPDAETIAVNPQAAYAALTGTINNEATEVDVNRIKAEKLFAVMNKAADFMYVDSPFVEAFRRGGVIELQECNSCKAAILKSLNEALDDLNVIHTPTGEVIHRNKDCIVVVTANVGQGYEGINAFSNDFIARFHQADVFELPDDRVLIQRVKARSGYDDEKVISKMIVVMREIQRVLLEAKGDYGSCSPRGLIAWARKTKNCGNAYKAALKTIVGLATQDPEIRVDLIHALETQFSPSI